MANPISRRTEDKRESGFQRTGAGSAGAGTEPAAELPAPEPLLGAERLEAAIQAHNHELVERAGSLFELPLVVLIEQRDQALQRLARAQEREAVQRRRWVAEQDKFIGFLMTEHEAKLQQLRADYERMQTEFEATRSAAPDTAGITLVTELAWDEPKLQELQEALAAANTEIDETRADAQRLQEERDDAIRATDDMRLELTSELESARDEGFQLETRLDEAHRLLEDVRDQARDEVLRLTEEVADLRAELDTRNGEIQRLRTRLVAHTIPTARDAPVRRTGVAPRRQ